MIYNLSTADTTVEWGLTGRDRVAQNVLNIIRTRRGEVAFMPEFGLHEDHIDSTEAYISNKIANDISELVEKYESRAKVLDVNTDERDKDGNVIIKVRVEV